MRCHQCHTKDFKEGLIVLTIAGPLDIGATALLCSRNCLVDYTAQLIALSDKDSPWANHS